MVGITGFSHLATAKVLGIQNQRLAQCRFAKVNFLGPDKVAVQVDGEAWLQEPGTIVVSHKNKARMLFKSKVQCLESVCVCVCVCVMLPFLAKYIVFSSHIAARCHHSIS